MYRERSSSQSLESVEKDVYSLPKIPNAEFIARRLETYINAFFRSVKALSKGNAIGSRLEAASSIWPLLDVLFAIHGRLTPNLSLVEQELQATRLGKLDCDTDALLRLILDVLGGELVAQQVLLSHAEKLCRAEGFAAIFDEWEGACGWARDYHSTRPVIVTPPSTPPPGTQRPSVSLVVRPVRASPLLHPLDCPPAGPVGAAPSLATAAVPARLPPVPPEVARAREEQVQQQCTLASCGVLTPTETISPALVAILNSCASALDADSRPF